MSDNDLPTGDEAYDSLCRDGDQFATSPLEPVELDGLTYAHPKWGRVVMTADQRVVSSIGTLYLHHAGLGEALRQMGGRTATMAEGIRLVGRYFKSPRLIWGISGFAATGFPCVHQARNLKKVFRYFLSSQEKTPSLITDGGGSAGVLGLSGVLAEMHGIPTLGVSPLQGLRKMAPRTHMLIYGDTYVDRQIIVGVLSDVLICVEGGDGTKQECLTALRHGAHVVLLAFSQDPRLLGGSWRTEPEMLAAEADGRLVVCHSPNDIYGQLEQARRRALRTLYRSRARRLQTFTTTLTI